MSITHRVKRLLGISLAGAMVLALMPAGVAAANVIDTGDVDACDLEGFETPTFNDSLGFFEAEIECMASYGITVGDAEGNYNSTGTVTRQQMALFIARLASQAQAGDTTSIPAFEDDAFDDIANVNPPEARDAINWLAQLEITTGVAGGDSYNPSGTVTRQQMASFIARAHAALDVDFSGVVVEEGVFEDVVEGNVHKDNIELLAAVGVVAGTAEGQYSPANPVTRGQMSAFIVRSIGVLESQGLWNGVPTVPSLALTFTVLDGAVLGSLNTTDGRDDLGTNDNLLALSDGDAVTVFQFSVPEDDFFIEGEPATPTAFLNALEVGATLVASATADGFAHDLTPAPERFLEGTIGDGLTEIVDPASGVQLQDISAWVSGQEYTVDGAAASEGEFLDNLSPGDQISIEVLFEDESNFDSSVFRHNLTNATLEGTVVAQAASTFTVDPNTDDDGVVGGALPNFNIPGFVISDNAGSGADLDAIELTLDGTTSTPANIAAVVSTSGFDNGGAVSYARVDSSTASVDGDVTIVYTSDTSDTVYEGVVESVTDNASGDTVALISTSGFTNPPFVAADQIELNTAAVSDDTALVSTIRVDGVVTASTDLDTVLSAGDTVTLTIPFGQSSGVLAFTSANLQGEVSARTAPNLTLDVSSTEQATVDYTAAPFGYSANVQYFVDGSIVNQTAFETAIDDGIAASGVDVLLEVTDTGTTTQFRVTTQ